MTSTWRGSPAALNVSFRAGSVRRHVVVPTGFGPVGAGNSTAAASVCGAGPLAWRGARAAIANTATSTLVISAACSHPVEKYSNARLGIACRQVADDGNGCRARFENGTRSLYRYAADGHEREPRQARAFGRGAHHIESDRTVTGRFRHGAEYRSNCHVGHRLAHGRRHLVDRVRREAHDRT